MLVGRATPPFKGHQSAATDDRATNVFEGQSGLDLPRIGADTFIRNRSSWSRTDIPATDRWTRGVHGRAAIEMFEISLVSAFSGYQLTDLACQPASQPLLLRPLHARHRSDDGRQRACCCHWIKRDVVNVLFVHSIYRDQDDAKRNKEDKVRWDCWL